MRLVRWHDGRCFRTALHVSTERKTYRLVVITERGVRLEKPPLAEVLVDLGEARPKHLKTYRHAGQVLGITKTARAALKGT